MTTLLNIYEAIAADNIQDNQIAFLRDRQKQGKIIEVKGHHFSLLSSCSHVKNYYYYYYYYPANYITKNKTKKYTSKLISIY